MSKGEGGWGRERETSQNWFPALSLPTSFLHSSHRARTYTNTHTHAHARARGRTYTHTQYAQAHTRTHTHLHTHTHTHTQGIEANDYDSNEHCTCNVLQAQLDVVNMKFKDREKM